MLSFRQLVALILVVCTPPAAAQTAILQLQILEGEGAVQAAGARALRPITVQITDETGKPVNGAAVSFRMPDEGVTGVFGNGLKSSLVLTGVDGRASEWSARWGPETGPARVRITAAKEQARTGAIVNQYVSDAVAAPVAPAPRPESVSQAKIPSVVPVRPAAMLPSASSGITIFETPKGQGPGLSRAWWLLLLAGAAGGGAYLLAQKKASGGGGATGTVPAAGASTAASPGIRFGSPVITIGRP